MTAAWLTRRPDPLISVVTPSYRQEEYLEECIRSVLDQGYERLEYLVVDGGGSPRAVEILRSFGDRIAWWVSEPDGGQSDAINKGLRRASGDLVSWLNSDDYLLPGALEAVAASYRAHPEASFHFGDGLRVDASGRTLSGFFPEGRVAFELDALRFGLNTVLQPSAFIARSALSQIVLPRRPGGPDADEWVDTSLTWGMDTDLWIRLARCAPPAAIRRPLSASREYASTKTASGSFARIEELRRIAERHAGIAMTPGVLCYFLDTLSQLARERGDVYPEAFQKEIAAFWQATGRLLGRWGARPDGFPAPAKRKLW